MPQISDLLEDLEFISWVKYPNDELNTYWESWIQANPHRVEDIQLAKEVILGLHFPSKQASEEIKSDILFRLLQKEHIFKEDYSQPFIDQGNTWWSGAWQISKVAAILLFVFTFSFLFSLITQEQNSIQNGLFVQWEEKSAKNGEKLSFRLPDQTIVWLNSGSSLNYPQSFDSTVRLVKLKGEGFFEVAENADQPFQVLANGSLTTAIGTSFNINSKESKEVKVSLVSGKVSVKFLADSLSYFLLPGQELNYETSDQRILIERFDPEVVQGWKYGQLIFKQATMEEVIQELQDWYGVQIQLKGDPHRVWHFNGKFENQTLENVLESISNIEKFDFQILDKQVIIQFNL